MKRIEFVLTMPGVASWNGKWSGEGKHYAIVRTLAEKITARLNLDANGRASWSYNFGDGWCASVSARALPKGERAKKSAGFCGYDWMVESILRHGHIMSHAQEEAARNAAAHAPAPPATPGGA